MKKKLSILMALAVGAAVNAQEAPPAGGAVTAAGDGGGAVVAQATLVDANGVVFGGESQVVEITLVKPQAGDPRPTNAKGLVGKGKVAGHEYTIVLDGAKADGPLDLLRLISKDPAETQDVPMSSPAPGFAFSGKPVFLPGTDKVAMSVFCQIEKETAGKLMFQMIVKGLQTTCDFAGKPEKVLVIDQNNNGKLDDVWTFGKDKEGFITTSAETKHGDLMMIGEEQVMPGMPIIKDGAVWNLKVADGKVTAQRQDVKMGEVVWKGKPTEEFMVMLIGKTMILQESIKAGKKALPVGDYRLESLMYNDNGQVVVNYEKPKAVSIVAGKPLKLLPVTAVVAKVAATPINDKREIVLILKNAASDGGMVMFTMKPQKDQAVSMPPALRVLDAAGKEVYKGNFEYG
jgi:hypothetical protein